MPDSPFQENKELGSGSTRQLVTWIWVTWEMVSLPCLGAVTTPSWEQTVRGVVHYCIRQLQGDDNNSSLGEDLGRGCRQEGGVQGPPWERREKVGMTCANSVGKL